MPGKDPLYLNPLRGRWLRFSIVRSLALSWPDVSSPGRAATWPRSIILSVLTLILIGIFLRG